VSLDNHVKLKLEKGKTVFGTWNIIPSPQLCEIQSQTDIDFQILDMEHGLFNFESLENCIRAIELFNCSPLVRIAGLNLNDSQKALDSGAHGLIFPQVNSVFDCQQAINFSHYPPEGMRGYNPFTRSHGYSIKESSKLNRDRNNFAFTSVIIENISSFGNLEEILKIDALDLIYLGVYDMSVSLGKTGQFNDPELKKFIEVGIKKTRDSGKSVGLMTKDLDQAHFFKKLGANFIVLGVDSNLIGSNLNNLTQLMNKN
jgi:4-hydroxy-2-oxoheptanedioate aldolase